METEAAYLVVARFVKPHGLTGEAVVFPMTDRPEEVFVRGRELRPVTEDGRPEGDPLTVARGRPYQRRWLLRFTGIEDRTPLERWSVGYLGVKEDELEPPEPDEMYVHELPGATVHQGEQQIGIARDLIGPPSNQLLVVDGDQGEILIPFRPPILVRMDRESRRIEVALPPGLLEL